MTHRLRHILLSALEWLSRHERATLVAALASLALALWAASGIAIRSDLKELLPQNYQSVRELNRVLERVGGVGSLIVVAEGPEVQANQRFMDDLARELQGVELGLIRYVSYKADDIRRFYEDFSLSYIDPQDLELVYKRLKRRIDFEKFRRTPLMFLDEGEETTPPELSFDDIIDRNQKIFSAPVSTVDDYYGGEWGRLLIMVIRPYGATVTVESARRLVAAAERTVARLGPASYDPRMRVGFCGNVKSTIEEYDTLKRDVLSTALLCILLVAGAIALYFLRLRIVFLLGATLVLAISWTSALTRLAIGYLNAQTAFLGSIIVGTGINYGIILMARYLEERKKGCPPPESMRHALGMTLRPTFLAAATTAVSFAVLMIARIRGLSQFGFIGAAGVMLCWLATVGVLPAMALASERAMKLVRTRQPPRRHSALFDLAARTATRLPALCLVSGGVAAVVAAAVLWRFIPNAIEYDFTKMRNRVSVDSGTEALEKRVSKLFKHSMTPSAVLVDSVEEGEEVCRAVMRQNALLPPAEQRVGSCHSISDLLPMQQEAKLPILARIKGLLSQRWIGELDGELQERVKRIVASILGRPLSVEDLPEALTRHFEDLSGRRGAVVFINPRPGMLLSDGRNLMRFADTIRDIRLEDGRVLHAASEAIIFSDLIRIIKRDAPLLTLASFAGVVAFVILTLRRAKLSAVIVASLVWAVLVMAGIAAGMDIQINFFNFIVLPLTFGIGVDYGINVAVRIQQEGPAAVAHAVRHTGGAVILCSATTIIGYWVLTTAANQALATFGLAAVIGEVTCVVAAIALVPAFIVIFNRWRRGGP